MSTIPMLSNYAQYSESWLQESTAQAQRKLVSAQLQDERKVEPFYQFRKLLFALATRAPHLQEGARILDVGCGVGHYGVLLKNAAPFLFYTGTDFSPYMIQARLDRDADLRVAEFMDNDFHAYDVVLLSQAMEMTPDPRAALSHVLATLRNKSWLMLHRMRFDGAGERVVHEPTYNNQPAHNYIWDLDKLRWELGEWGSVTDTNTWTDQNTVSMLFHKDV